MRRRNAYPALPTKTFINPRDPSGAEYFYDDCGEVLYVIVLQNVGTCRVYSTYGAFEDLHVGDKREFYHDQNDKSWGMAEVIGIRHEDGTIEGLVPSVSYPHWVAK